MSRLTRQDGFTLIETLLASVVLLVGVLAVGGSIVVSNHSAATSGARTQATGVARRLIEVSRVTPSASLTAANVQAALMAGAPELTDANALLAGWQVARGGVEYTVATSVCDEDDPGDGLGAQRPGSCTPGQAPTTPPDGDPADYRRVTVAVSFNVPRSAPLRTVRQVGRFPIGGSSGGGVSEAPPAPGNVTMTSAPAACSGGPCITSQTTSSLSFAATMPSAPAGVQWLVNDGVLAGCPPASSLCSGAGTSWAFTWNIGLPVHDLNTGSINYGFCVAGNYVYDGVHAVGVRGVDASGRTSETSAVSVSLNRCPAIPPSGMNATGRESRSTVPVVDVVWDSSVEGDVIGYRVYKGTSGSQRTPVCPASITSGQFIALDAERECTDPSPPQFTNNAGPFYYGVYAIDRNPSTGAVREGAVAYVNVNSGNRAPNPPGSFAITATGPVRLSWTLPRTQDPDNGDSIDSFRIYRRSGTSTAAAPPSGYLDRYDREARAQLCSGSTCSYTDPAALGTTATYWVTSVDQHMRESTYVGPRSR